MWELDCEESWALKNWCFWTVLLEKTLESPLHCKEIQPVYPKGDQSRVFIGGTDVEAETPIRWPPNAKSWLIWKDSDAGKNWGQEEKGMTEEEMVRWHHGLNEHGFGWTPGVGDGQGGLACCSSWGHKESDTIDWLNWTELKWREIMMTSPTQWTWVRVDSRSWWWTGRPGVLWFMGSQRVGHDWVTELNWSTFAFIFMIFLLLPYWYLRFQQLKKNISYPKKRKLTFLTIWHNYTVINAIKTTRGQVTRFHMSSSTEVSLTEPLHNLSSANITQGYPSSCL